MKTERQRLKDQLIKNLYLQFEYYEKKGWKQGDKTGIAKRFGYNQDYIYVLYKNWKKSKKNT